MTLEQKRAAKAFEDVTTLARSYDEGSAERKSYGSLALKLPALVRTAGLCQALYFLDSRDKGSPDDTPAKAPPSKTLLRHLAGQLSRIDDAIDGTSDSLLARVRSAELADYLRLSRETIAVANWYSRLTRSILKVEPTDDAGGEKK
jgi:CRISPR-associated protein Cmr5